MKIVIFNTLYHPYQIGGAEKSVRALSEEFCSLGNEVLVITLGEKDDFFNLNGVSVKVLKLENKYWPYNESEKKIFEKLQWHIRDVSNNNYNKNIKSTLNSFNPDIVFTNNLSGFSTNIWSLAKELNIKIVHTLRDYYTQCPRTTKFKNGENCKQICLDCNLLSKIKKKNIDNIDYLVGISKYILDDHINNGFFKEIPQKVIYNGFDLPFKKEKKKERGLETVTFGFIGQLNESKGIELILESFKSIKETNWKFLIAGKANEKYISKLKEINNSVNITFLGYVESNAFFKSINVLIAPSIWNEPFGRVVIESILHSKPVIASNMGGIPELLINNKQFVFRPKVKELRTLIQKIILNSNFLDEFKFEKTYLEKFNIKNTVQQYLEIFNKIIKN
jgi:glycosyltransferase involved in cell wall biosynthesis